LWFFNREWKSRFIAHFFVVKKDWYRVLPVQSLIASYFTVKIIKKLEFAYLPDELEMQEYFDHFNPSEK
jgi:hypothetical protein